MLLMHPMRVTWLSCDKSVYYPAHSLITNNYQSICKIDCSIHMYGSMLINPQSNQSINWFIHQPINHFWQQDHVIRLWLEHLSNMLQFWGKVQNIHNVAVYSMLERTIKDFLVVFVFISSEGRIFLALI